jgi:RNA polymerase sigma-70 factor (ECF subfamily)
MPWGRQLRRGTTGCLLQAAQSDPDAFAAFYDAYIERVMGYFVRRTFDAELARDLSAKTFATALLRRGDFRGRTDEQERAWLFAIARTQLSHYHRRGQVERRAVQRLGIMTARMEPDEIARVEEQAGIATLRPRLAGALESLHTEQRQAVELRVVHELEYASIAEAMHSTEEVARARVSRGLRTLARVLEHDGPWSEEVA